MKANELRIGNYVNGGTVYLNQMVVGITPSEIITINGKHYDIEDDLIQPIPLTPEILEKAGFVRESGAYIIQLDDSGNHLSFVKNDNGFVCLSHMLNNVLKYLHQLQNLYFALCGSELNINL